MTKVICPKCGAEIAIADHQHVAIGIVVGKDSGLGTVKLPLADEQQKKPKSKAQLRIDAMRAAGMDVSKFFCMKDGKGEETLVGSLDGGEFALIDTNDPIVNKIVDAGSILNAHLFKQHVLAQVLKMMTSYKYDRTLNRVVRVRTWDGKLDLSSYTQHMNAMGYGYSWHTLVDELKRQAAMHRHGDKKSLEEDQRWYNKDLALAMFDHHHRLLVDLTEKLRIRRHQGVEYIALQGVDNLVYQKQSANGYIYLYEVERMLKAHASMRKNIMKAANPVELYNAVARYIEAARPGKLSYHASEVTKRENRVEIVPCEEWKNAYKGYGGYFAMQNLIMFHGCRIIVDGKKFSKDNSMKQLDKWANEHLKEGYWLIGALKQLIADNGFNIERKQAEWYEKKRNQ